MTACEPCWNEAFRQSRMLGGSQVDHYRRLLDVLEHPHLALLPADLPAPTGANDEEVGPPVVQREDRYTITVDGFRVTATDDQEARIRAMTAGQAARFVRAMGGAR